LQPSQPPAYYSYTHLAPTSDLSLLSLKPALPSVDPNEQFVDGDNFLPGEYEEEELNGKVKVVHFGIV